MQGSPLFSPDGKHVAYAAKNRNKWLVVVDGRPGPECGFIVRGGPTFHADGVLEYLAVKLVGKKKTLHRIKHVPVRK